MYMFGDVSLDLVVVNSNGADRFGGAEVGVGAIVVS